MTDAILTLNAGSSTLKWALFDSGLTLLARDTLEHHDVSAIWRQIEASHGGVNIRAAGHRLVHGGRELSAPIVLNRDSIQTLETLIPLAPLHLEPELQIIHAVAAYDPELVQIACFDTAFHHTQHALARRFALPTSYTEEGIVRYGFHGLSYDYIASQLPDVTDRAEGKTIVAHLGNGASICAMENCQSVATSMGFSALDGLMMGTRSGAIDPGVLLYLIQQKQMSADAVHHLLYKESGLLGVSGISHDVRLLEQSDDPRAALALDLFCYRAACDMASLVSALGGMDTLVFTAGIGENSTLIRRKICEQNHWLGIALDAERNRAHHTRISTDDSPVEVYVIPTNEECMIAKHTARMIAE